MDWHDKLCPNNVFKPLHKLIDRLIQLESADWSAYDKLWLQSNYSIKCKSKTGQFRIWISSEKLFTSEKTILPGHYCAVLFKVTLHTLNWRIIITLKTNNDWLLYCQSHFHYSSQTVPSMLLETLNNNEMLLLSWFTILLWSGLVWMVFVRVIRVNERKWEVFEWLES